MTRGQRAAAWVGAAVIGFLVLVVGIVVMLGGVIKVGYEP